MAKVSLGFALYQGDQLLRRETVSQDIVKVGKDPKSHIVIDDEDAARMHAVIEVGDSDDITLIDLGNGTQVNGATVNKCKLQVGDQIMIGKTRLVLENAGATAPALAAPSAPVNPFAAAASAPTANPFGAPAANPFGAPPAAPAFGGSNPFAAASSTSNPFAASTQGHGHGRHGHDDMAPGTYTYRLIKSGPDVPSHEVELPHVQTLEVMVMWGSNVLHVTHLTPPRSFYVGEEQGKNLNCDFFIPSEKIGSTRMPVVIADAGGISVVLPAGAKGNVELPGQGKLSLDEARSKATPCGELAGAHQISIGNGGSARVEVAEFVFQVTATAAGKPTPAGLGAGFDWNVAAYFGLSFATFASLIGAMAFFVPPMGMTEDGGIDKDQMVLIAAYLKAAAEREMEEKETEQVTDDNADNKEGGTGTRAKGEEGSMGKTDSNATNKRYAVKGAADNPDPHLARAAALREATEFGMVGLLNVGAAGDPNAPTAPWGRDTSSGTDAVSARGNMWGDEIGDAFGNGGLGLSGLGEGGGGRGEGIGLGNIGTMGHGAGTGTGQGFGSGHGRLGGSHRAKAPNIRMGATQVSGRLPPEVIRRIVRQNYGRFRMCYEQGLARNPNLQGRATMRFVIGRDGSVSQVQNGGSDLPDQQVISCVQRAYYGLSFPQPEGGIVTVVYPIMFEPG